MDVHKNGVEPWKVTLVDTGDGTMTGGRLRRVREHLQDGTFCLTYGDGVSDVNIKELIQFHQTNKGLATLTAVQPPGRFGAFNLADEQTHINDFREKPQGNTAWINGGFFVLEPDVIDYIDSDATTWEREPMESLAEEGKLLAYRHSGFWHPMDTLRDKNTLDQMWVQDTAPWKLWRDA